MPGQPQQRQDTLIRQLQLAVAAAGAKHLTAVFGTGADWVTCPANVSTNLTAVGADVDDAEGNFDLATGNYNTGEDGWYLFTAVVTIDAGSFTGWGARLGIVTNGWGTQLKSSDKRDWTNIGSSIQVNGLIPVTAGLAHVFIVPDAAVDAQLTFFSAAKIG